jgi:hypothetical protein
MPDIKLDHFRRAAADAGAHGDNDMLPFDVDTGDEVGLAELAFSFCLEASRRHTGRRSAAETGTPGISGLGLRVISDAWHSSFSKSAPCEESLYGQL